MPRAIDDARFWNGIAAKYAADPISDLPGYERSLARIRHHLEGAERVVEYGCGTGSTALRLADLVGRLDAADISHRMIAIARQKARDAAVANLVFAVGTAETLDVPDGAADAVLALNLLHLLRDRAATYRAAHRALRPGGLFISKTACLSEMSPLIRLALPVMQMLGRAPHVSTFAGAALQAEIKAAGFEIVERGRHGSGRRDFRLFLVARKPGAAEAG